MPAPKGNQFAKGAYGRGQGRKSTYKKEHAKIAYNMCLLGATDEQLAQVFEVSSRTINKWKTQFDDFRSAIRRGRTLEDGEIVAALAKTAKGYTHPEEKIFQYKGEVIRAKTRKRYAPDTQAAIFLLGVRQSMAKLKAQDPPKDDSQGSGDLPSSIDLSKLGPDTLKMIYADLIRAQHKETGQAQEAVGPESDNHYTEES